jgi:hypothetical protein
MDWRRTDRQVCAALHAPPATWLGAGGTTFDGCMFSAQRSETKRNETPLQDVSTSLVFSSAPRRRERSTTVHSLLNGAASSGVQPHHAWPSLTATRSKTWMNAL